MDRRGFLRLLGLAPVAGMAAEKLIVEARAGDTLWNDERPLSPVPVPPTVHRPIERRMVECVIWIPDRELYNNAGNTNIANLVAIKLEQARLSILDHISTHYPELVK